MNNIERALYRVSSNLKTKQNKVQPDKVSVMALSAQKTMSSGGCQKTKVTAYPGYYHQIKCTTKKRCVSKTATVKQNYDELTFSSGSSWRRICCRRANSNLCCV